MSSRLQRLARLAAGQFTPYLVASWSDEDRELVRSWREGSSLEGAPDELVAAVVSGFGHGWSGVGANLGRTGIQVALQALRLPPASDVLIPAYACAGVAVPVLQAGFRPVLVDVDSDLNISFGSVAAAESKQVRAVIVPHFGGLWARDADAIFSWARERGVAIIEDVAQAQGLVHGGQPAGGFGDVGIFSFGGGKLVFGPGGGVAVSRDEALVRRMRDGLAAHEPRTIVQARVDAFAKRFAVPIPARSRQELRTTLAVRLAPHRAGGPVADEANPHGFAAYALSGIEAALAVRQTGGAERIIEGQTANAARWRTLVSGLPGVRLSPEGENVFTKLWLVVEGKEAESRAVRFRATLRRHGVETETLYVPLNQRSEFAGLRSVPLPTTEALWRSVFALPVRPSLTGADWSRIDAAIGDIRGEEGR